MNYRVVYLLNGESKKYVEKLIRDVAKKFNVNYVYSGKTPAHITLKYMFETDNVKRIENTINKICKRIKSSTFEIGKVGNFEKNALILKIKPSNEMIKFEKQLIKELHNFRGDLFKFDKSLYKNFHIGIAHHDIKEKYNEIKSYLEEHNKKFKIKFDQVYLIKKPKNKWIIQKEFKIK